MSFAQQIRDILGNSMSLLDIQKVIDTHPEPNNLDAILDTILSREPQPEIKNETHESSEGSETESDTDSEDERRVEEEMKAEKEIQFKETAKYIVDILGDMYPMDQVLEVVRKHPQSYNVEAVMDAVLDSINIRTVSNNWINQIRESGELMKISDEEFIDEEKKEEKKEEMIDEFEFKVAEDKEEDLTEREKYRRGVITSLLSTEEDKELAESAYQMFGKKKYSIDTILCLIRHSENRDIQEIVKKLNEGIDSEELFKKDNERLETFPEENCLVCFDTFAATDMFTLGCEEKHKYCYDCLNEYLGVNIGDGNIPTCLTPGCGYIITEREVLYICGRESPLTNKYSRILLREGLMSLENCVGCPTPGCENWLVLGDPSVKTRCDCEMCGNSFCSLCKGLYHYGIDCDQVQDYTMKWMRWNENRKENSEKLQAVRDLRERLEEFQKDEEWKRMHLRRCPRCKRAIEKVSGCDSMKCGRDYHGGNKQKGCGKRFNWTAALPYESDNQNPLMNQPLSMVQEDVKLDHGEFLPCDVCHSRIIGIRFCCLNCPCFNVCETCEPNLEHNAKHVFDVVGVQFIFQAAEKHKGLMERLRDKVHRKKATLLRTFKMLLTNPEDVSIQNANSNSINID